VAVCWTDVAPSGCAVDNPNPTDSIEAHDIEHPRYLSVNVHVLVHMLLVNNQQRIQNTGTGTGPHPPRLGMSSRLMVHDLQVMVCVSAGLAAVAAKEPIDTCRRRCQVHLQLIACTLSTPHTLVPW